jgi:glycosyltransferase involved in cell wall biosynthesis
MGRSSLRASIIVCTYNRCIQLEQCLKSVCVQNYPAGQYEILVIDNNSIDNTPFVVGNLIKAHPKHNIRYILEEKQGLSVARNRGVIEAKSEIVVFIDDDAMAEPDWLPEILSSFKDANVYAVGGRVELKFPKSPPKWLKSQFIRTFLSEFIPDSNTEYVHQGKGNLPVGCNLAFRRKALDLAGKFDPNLGRCGLDVIGGEEIKVLQKLQSLNRMLVIQPKAIVFHIVPNERMNKDYFYKINAALPRVRLQFLAHDSFASKMYYFLRFFIGSFIQNFLFVIKLIFTVEASERFGILLKIHRNFSKLYLAMKYLFNF